MTGADGLTVAVTGPTGDIGRSLLGALERSERVTRVLGMARRPFDPGVHGWSKVSYRQGDVLDPESVAALVADADVVVHLAFLIFGNREQTRQVNIRGSRNVFEAVAEAGTRRFVYTSSVAVYGFGDDIPEHVDETVPPHGTEAFYYSAQKAELEALLREILGAAAVDLYILRPVVVAGPDALLLVDSIAKSFQIGGRWPVERNVVKALPWLRPMLPDPGVAMQLVHHDDVANALVAAIEGKGTPGVYNLAAPDPVSLSEVAHALGWRPLPIPQRAVPVAAAAVERLQRFLPQDLAWVNAMRKTLILDTTKARTELGWHPHHSAHATLRETAIAARLQGLV
ncbi:NAD-dependent epimerase/dehydratase family protein [Mycolicibacterium austroafricanum]|uniref:NAD-dependent epimerase/dehydratase family protein n=1 Tax=Mycolicibacterium austroafricanum TaxID=39687 RepID=UPI001CA326BA|nr:NAD-dependent epimerase/dehydratase family protein [Mycolicibacterium austroafricanum]QZT64810.1 NAD-dependent epimerase/dehydratase family protein [Mycolicibacterium austroafricanum]